MNHQILIHSKENDQTTHDVLSWIFFFKARNVVRENGSISFPLNGFSLNQDESRNIWENTRYWYRRGKLKFENINNRLFVNNTLQTIARFDISIYESTFNSLIQKIPHINKPCDNDLDKMQAYILADKLGINIPTTWVCNNLSNAPFLSEKPDVKILIKPLYFNGLKMEYDTKIVHLFSKLILLKRSEINLKNLPDLFFSTIFQKYVEKKYEIRSFYLNGIFKSMAIFSQQNEKTKVDFREYDLERPNRCVPYNLPKKLEAKLHKLMLNLKINSGSIDIIVTPDDEYFFLEVNPTGQFNWLSKECNYFIERLIAKELTKPI
jgi:ATP-GRASP peptide maturase of grasp-with-spasm system